MRRLCFLLLTTILLAGNTIVASAQQLLTITDSKNRPSTDGAPRFETTDCPFTTFSGNQIECGWLIVPEDHATPDGATIQLAVAILRSKNPQKAPDPLVYLAGGPGGAFVATAPLLTLRFGLGTLLADRDVILVDQRGMGLSQPTVSCIPFESPLEFYQTPFPPPNINERLQTCLDQFKQQNLHIEFYTTPQNAADFEALRTALGYDKINLYGTSWGTRLALTVLRNHPAGIRSVILDSTLPPDQNSMDSYPYAFDRAFSAVERACAADLLCRLAYPDLRNTYETTYQGLKDNPVELVVDGQSIWVTAEKFEQQVAGMLVNKATVALLPGFITAAARRDFKTMIPLIRPILRARHDQLPQVGLYLSYNCADDAGSTSLSAIESSAAAYSESMRNPDALGGLTGYRFCQMIGLTASREANSPTVSDVPTLIFAGGFDSLTPPAWGQHAATTLSSSYFLEFPHESHAFAGENTCAQTIMARFLQNPATAPDSSCIAALPSPSFVVTTDVTRPFALAGTLLLALIAGVALGQAEYTLVRGTYPLIWWAGLRSAGWIAPLLSAAGILLIAVVGNSTAFETDRLRMVETVIPLVMALQAASIFSPADDPALEVLLACPRPIRWAILERFGAVLVTQMIIGFLGCLISLVLVPDQNILIAVLRWIPPTIFLAGVGIYVTIRSRVSTFGMVIGGLLWFAFQMFGGFFLPGTLNLPIIGLIQPLIWPFHIYLQPGDLTMADYWLNRVAVTAAGIGLILMALRQLRSTEQVLLGAQQTKQSGRKPPQLSGEVALQTPNLQTIQTVVTPQTGLSTSIRQVIGLSGYEFRAQWRRRSLLIMIVAIMAISSLFMIIIGSDLSGISGGQLNLNTAMMAPEQAQQTFGYLVVFATWAPVAGALIFFLPLLVADTIPLDRQQNVSELLEALPRSTAVYLWSKLLGAWAAVLVGMLITMIVLLIGWRLRLGPYNLALYFEMWLIGAIPMALANTGFGVLVGAMQPSRRRAVALVIAAMLSGAILTTLLGGLANWAPTRGPVFTYYLNQSIEGLLKSTPYTGFSAPDVVLTILFGFIELVVLWILVWGWRRSHRI